MTQDIVVYDIAYQLTRNIPWFSLTTEALSISKGFYKLEKCLDQIIEGQEISSKLEAFKYLRAYAYCNIEKINTIEEASINGYLASSLKESGYLFLLKFLDEMKSVKRIPITTESISIKDKVCNLFEWLFNQAEHYLQHERFLSRLVVCSILFTIAVFVLQYLGVEISEKLLLFGTLAVMSASTLTGKSNKNSK